MGKCTYIDGVGSSQAIDTAGEIVDLQGLDVSSLIGAAFNFEHESKLPSQIVGKILDAKKIFSEEDCENDRQRYYWDKCKIPFLYVFGRLFDDKKESSKEVAALFKDDEEHPDEPDMVGFSVEGSKISKTGNVVTHSIARKITVTHIPANKTCIAELIPEKETKKDDFTSLFKGEAELFSFEPSYVELLEKADAHGEPLMKPYSSEAQRRWAHTQVGKEALGGEAAVHEWDEATKGKKLPEKVKKSDMKKDVGSGGGAFIGSQLAMSEGKGKLKKALSAGSMMAAPGNLEGGAALTPESLERKAQKVNSLKKKEKSRWFTRADESYQSWPERENFRGYMRERMPHLAEGEIDAIGRVLALKKDRQREGQLSKMYASYYAKAEKMGKTTDIMMANEEENLDKYLMQSESKKKEK